MPEPGEAGGTVPVQAPNGETPESVRSYDQMVSEATARTFTFQLGGEAWQMASPDSSDWQLQVRVGQGDVAAQVDLVAELLGDEQWQRFRKLTVPAKVIAAILQDCATHYGIDMGESPASPA